MKNIVVEFANTNNLNIKNISIEFGKLTVCVGPSGSGKSSFAFDTLIERKNCKITAYPDKVRCVSQRIYSTTEKIKEIYNLKDECNSLIVIDEPLSGMLKEEALKVSNFIKELSEKNAVVVVEHRLEIFPLADVILEFGPSSGVNGGKIINITKGNVYASKHSIEPINRKKNTSNKKIKAVYSEFNGIPNYTVELTLNTITSITGLSGSGKSIYLDAIYKAFDKSSGASERRKNLIETKNKSLIRRPHIIDATPVSKNSRSTVATYYGVSKFFTNQDMDLTIEEAIKKYANNNLIIRRLMFLKDIGLDYLRLNQKSYTLSGGECQRIKLAKLLCKKLGDRSIYIFDNPVRGLGNNNIEKVMNMFDKLVHKNNTVLIAENDPIALLYVDNIIEVKR